MANTYICTCPDASKQVLSNPYSRYTDRWDIIDLSSTGMGSTTGECKHILATKIVRGELTEVPTDVPGTGVESEFISL